MMGRAGRARQKTEHADSSEAPFLIHWYPPPYG
jgi:hypothetical protein